MQEGINLRFLHFFFHHHHLIEKSTEKKERRRISKQGEFFKTSINFQNKIHLPAYRLTNNYPLLHTTTHYLQLHTQLTNMVNIPNTSKVQNKYNDTTKRKYMSWCPHHFYTGYRDNYSYWETKIVLALVKLNQASKLNYVNVPANTMLDPTRSGPEKNEIYFHFKSHKFNTVKPFELIIKNESMKQNPVTVKFISRKSFKYWLY